MEFKDLPMLFDQGQTVIAIEAPLTERMKVLEFLYEVAVSRKLPLYFWNQGYTRLQQVVEFTRLIPTNTECTSGLVWLLEHVQAPIQERESGGVGDKGNGELVANQPP